MSRQTDKPVDYGKITNAISSAIMDRFSNTGLIAPVAPDVRIDDKTCLVTGANSGLGKAIAIDLARRGGHVLMACRGGHPEAGEDVKRLSGSPRVEMLKVDLSDLESVHLLCDEIARRGTPLDITVLNAGLMPLNARPSRQGFELMFAVHFLANRVLLDRLIGDGVIVPGGQPDRTPRIVFVVSETHRSAGPIDFEHFGAFTDYGLKDGLKYYGLSKLHSCTLAQEMSRRLNPGEEVRVAVHSLCPGPINSNIAREAPSYMKAFLSPVMGLLFAGPEKAARPVIHLCCDAEMGQRSGVYLHMMREKQPSALALDLSSGASLWEASEALIAEHRPARAAAETRAAARECGGDAGAPR